MLATKSLKFDEAYAARIVTINRFTPHPNPEVQRLKCCSVNGYNVITGIDEIPGVFVFFPMMTVISDKFLSWANMFRHSELNMDKSKSGMFEDNGRVKPVKLKGEVSEGLIVPIEALEQFVKDELSEDSVVYTMDGAFDQLTGTSQQFQLCRKFIVEKRKVLGSTPKNGKTKIHVDSTQFRFHYNCGMLKNSPYIIQPDSIIQVSSKIHGTSFICGYLLCKKQLPWYKKLAYKLFSNEPYKEYDYVYASRTMIRGYGVESNYCGNVWETVCPRLFDKLDKGITIYGEIVGYDPQGNYIQEGYDYGCTKPDNEYISEVNYKVRVYRVTYTNVDGIVHEFSAKEVQIWCMEKGLTSVTELYYGPAKNLYPSIDVGDTFGENFLHSIQNDTGFYMEQPSPDCVNKVPHEGVVIRIEDTIPRSWKVKCFSFLSKQFKEENFNIEDVS